MTKLLDEAVAAVSSLSDALQNEATRLLLQFTGVEPLLELDEEDVRELTASLAEAERNFATDAEIRAIWAKRGR